MSRTKRLMAVPPLRAKEVSSATSGSARTSSAAWRRYSSETGIEVLRHGDVVFGVELSAPHQHPFAFAEVYAGAVERLQPGVIVALREPEEQPLDLDALALSQERMK